MLGSFSSLWEVSFHRASQECFVRELQSSLCYNTENLQLELEYRGRFSCLSQRAISRIAADLIARGVVIVRTVCRGSILLDEIEGGKQAGVDS